MPRSAPSPLARIVHASLVLSFSSPHSSAHLLCHVVSLTPTSSRYLTCIVSRFSSKPAVYLSISADSAQVVDSTLDVLAVNCMTLFATG
ncbi:uncharacterized protein BKA55DRAFT_557155 [Fusarium redolens]|uniref:Uncharacterized protein n=1 Tax=Fusarium redolens TaxID=48865 RepID=A0A9P9HY84_FUSRE|nr:uncharacterized protein BKA55DRAFT_557155 [Fusarium redolens]KAH7264864.1 hypothetical protein BKA55DRAFT_557155 [Fusarium redolens]